MNENQPISDSNMPEHMHRELLRRKAGLEQRIKNKENRRPNIEEERVINDFEIFAQDELNPLNENGVNAVKERMERLVETGIERSHLIRAIREIVLRSFHDY